MAQDPKDKHASDTSTRVGYGNPPAENRFRKGQSGNPKGRPRKEAPPQITFGDRHSERSFERAAYRPITLIQNGKPVTMTAREALDQSMFNQAIKGNRLQAQYLDKQLRAAEAQEAKEARDYYHHMVKAKASGEAEIARCEKLGLEPPRLYPHPKDIVIDPFRREVHVLGPYNAEQAKLPDQTLLLCRLNLGFSALDKLNRKKARADDAHCLYTVQALLAHELLPPSYGGGEERAWIRLALEWHGLNRREIRQKMDEIDRQLQALPPEDVAQMMKERSARHTRIQKRLQLNADVLRLITDVQQSGRPMAEDAARAALQQLMRKYYPGYK